MPYPARSLKEITQLLLAREPLPLLVPTCVYDLALTPQIEAAAGDALQKIGLHLLNDDLETAHLLAQHHEGIPQADYWHAIIHRREGDYSNARYWLGRIGPLLLLTQIYGMDSNAPADFIVRCRTLGRGSDPEAEQFQWSEIAQILRSLSTEAN